MTETLNRLTINCASLLQTPVSQWSDVRPPFWGALSQAIANLSNSGSPGSISAPGLPAFTAAAAPFMQLTEAVNYSSALMIMPVDEGIEPAAQEESANWMGLWAEITGGLTRLMDGMTRRLEESLGAGLVSSRSIATSLTSQTSISRSLTEISSQQHQWDTLQHAVPHSPTGGSALKRDIFSSIEVRSQESAARPLLNSDSWSLDSYPTGISSLQWIPLIETVSHDQQRQWHASQHGISRSLTEMSAQHQGTDWLMPQTLQNITMTVPSLSSGVPLSDPLSNPVPTIAEFSNTNTILKQFPQASSAVLPPPHSQAPTEPSSNSSSVTFNGGIHVQITAQTVDTAHAEETARVIANQVLREMNRLTEQSRFRRGLSPTPLF